ncbi:MAG TPA: hypothetical protein VFB58_15530 [Chloroflexota bacterium]|nr:hypothetical protein [Chloroflexota bacterium]
MDELKPRMPIRRFDVFADYHRVQNEERGMPENLAKGRAVWAAKVVAGRRYGGVPSTGPHAGKLGGRAAAEPEEDNEFRSIGGVPQTDQTFDREIIDRMGPEFYRQVFHPAIAEAARNGKRYEDIRDEIRAPWKR